ncbi:MAG: hypothetical protein P1V36_08505 [Planctomycetota bacterium]|nr:hypothetical protein [Planctomycetota bacterium]
MQRLMTLCLVLLAVCALAACGNEADDAGPNAWHHVRVEGLAGATGLTLAGDDLVFVCGDDRRDILTVPSRDLTSGGTVRVRTLALTTRPDAPVAGSTPFAWQRYQLQHLWNVPVDFQAVAFQPPNVLYVGERNRRVLFWGRLRRDATGALASVKLDHIAIVPGGDRSGRDAGDWTDKGSGLRALVAVQRSASMEDLWAVDRGEAGQPISVRRMDRYGSNLQGIRARHGFEAGPDVRAISHDGSRLLVLLGRGRGRLVSLVPPAPGKLESVPNVTGVPGPAVDGVEGWTGMAHGADGTVYLVSGGSPAVVAWRRP